MLIMKSLIYNKTSTANVITQIYGDCYLKVEIGDLCTNIDISNCYDKPYIDCLDNEISTQFMILILVTATTNHTLII